MADVTGEPLKPCPFCGGEACIERGHFSVPVVRCGDCGASAGDGATRDPVDSRIEKWNRRAITNHPYRGGS